MKFCLSKDKCILFRTMYKGELVFRRILPQKTWNKENITKRWKRKRYHEYGYIWKEGREHTMLITDRLSHQSSCDLYITGCTITLSDPDDRSAWHRQPLLARLVTKKHEQSLYIQCTLGWEWILVAYVIVEMYYCPLMILTKHINPLLVTVFCLIPYSP